MPFKLWMNLVLSSVPLAVLLLTCLVLWNVESTTKFIFCIDFSI